MMRPNPSDFGGGNDLGPIGGGAGWALAAAYTLAVLVLVVFVAELGGWMLPRLAAVLAP